MRDTIDRWTERLGDEAPYWALAFTCLAGLVFKLHCGAYWIGAEQYTTGCYSDAVPFWGLRGVAAGQVPYWEARMEYPFLTGALIWVEGLVARLLGLGRPDAADFLTAVWLGNIGFAYLILRMMRRAGVGRVRQYAWALAPPLVLYLAHNWDLLAAAFAVAAVLAAHRANDVRATALAALGGAAKLFPLLLLPLLGLGALFRRGRAVGANVTRAALLVAVALAAWGAVNLPVAATAFTNWSEFYAFSSQRSGTAASVWELANTFGWYPTDIPARNRLALIAFAVGAIAIVLAGWRRHGRHPWVLFTPMLAWFLLTNKVWSPQFDLWLWPLLVLTGTRARPLALFLLGDLLAYFAEFWLFAGLEGAWPSATQVDVATAAAVRGVAILWIIWAAVRDPAPTWIVRVTPPRSAAPRVPDRPIPTG